MKGHHHLHGNNLLTFSTGAMLLYASNTESELKGTKIKAGAFTAAPERSENATQT
jgi:hypothetical protein